MSDTLQADDNLQSGLTYTFVFNLENYITKPSVMTVLSDIRNNAPTFVSSPQVSWASGLWVLDNYLNVTFSYNGDGSDVVSDVADEIIAAIKQGSNDNVSFLAASAGTAGMNAQTDASKVATGIGQTVGQAAGAAVGATAEGAGKGLTTNLGLGGWAVLLIVLLGVLAYFSASTGIRVRNA